MEHRTGFEPVISALARQRATAVLPVQKALHAQGDLMQAPRAFYAVDWSCCAVDAELTGMSLVSDNCVPASCAKLRILTVAHFQDLGVSRVRHHTDLHGPEPSQRQRHAHALTWFWHRQGCVLLFHDIRLSAPAPVLDQGRVR